MELLKKMLYILIILFGILLLFSIIGRFYEIISDFISLFTIFSIDKSGEEIAYLLGKNFSAIIISFLGVFSINYGLKNFRKLR